MKICIVSDFFIPHYHGGGERRYYEIAKRLVKKGHQVDVICMKIAGVNNQEEIEGINIYHIGPTIDKPPQRSSLNFINFIFAVFKWILTQDYDIIDAQAYAPLIPAFLGAKIKRTPIIGTIYDVSTDGDDQWIQSTKIAAIAEKILVRLPYNKIITVSNETKKSLVKYYNVKKSRICVVYAGVDLEFIDSVEVNEKYENTIIFVGRLAPHKHVDHLLKVVKSLKKVIPSVKLIVVGNGAEKENLIKLTKELEIEDNVQFLHDLDYRELIGEIKKSNILALPSTREGFGMVLAEANACKIPVVAYASGGVVEVVEDGFNGFLVEPFDLENLECEIKSLLKNPSKRNNLGENGRKFVEKNFIWDKIVKDILNIYNQI
ncbi:MAG: glycosyltransferase family 4 protein [Methanobacteriaceae archaeon]|nr:glycosyltransferase family 4 protein [Methanobacteriaceae archaeon]MDP2837439.1 glycosyltransferase family 4 protein [Methanobacteriaceae archaeon]MDP3035607.1 glycosyltransferase family 4 protein [Methanobacteriaceae archaeon]MDP3484278.1 glycosyltransferase family 4 protein [Methanobacteriaceae archaeon]MDP3622400.1 glycosyltransferase family 4 protein [Methanobacteriaceae archaeon]